MNILIGAICGLLFFVVLILSFYSGYKVGSKTKPVVQTLTPDEQKKIEQMQKGWQNILNYDINVARGG